MKVHMQNWELWELKDYTKLRSMIIRELGRVDPSNPLVESCSQFMKPLINRVHANQNKLPFF